MLTNVNPSKTYAIHCVLIASTLLARMIVAASQVTKEMASIAYVGALLWIDVAGRNAVEDAFCHAWFSNENF